jgi:SAM-dependent methyltransferase
VDSVTKRTFDRVAWCYAWLERLAFGPLLQRTRTALLPALGDRRRVLILGEGDGRFLAAFCRAHPLAQIVVVDQSQRMIQLADTRLRAVDGACSRVEFRHEDAQSALPLPAEFDLVVCNFFLDCFDRAGIEQLLPRIEASLSPGGQLLLGDFHRPHRWLFRLIARPALFVMHAFFRRTAGITAQSLADLPAILAARGWHPLQVVERAGGFLHSSSWVRLCPPAAIEGSAGGRN